MLIYFGPFALLLYNTVFADAKCDSTFNNKSTLTVHSRDIKNHESCYFHVSAQKNMYIELNITDLHGFEPIENKSMFIPQCLPKIVIKEKNSSGEETTMKTICPEEKLSQVPQVFHSQSSFLTLLYQWVPGRYSGFTLYIDFHLKVNACRFSCDDSVCLSESKICNGKSDCLDRSDEQNCLKNPTIQPGASNAAVDIIQVIVIVIAVVFTLGLVVFVICHCGIPTRMCGDPDSRNRTPEHDHLHPSSQTACSEVVYVSGGPQDRFQREFALLKERQTRLKSIRADTELGLPPSIPISEDGEEGYVNSQRLLHSCDQKQERKSFCPPPNRTICDGESPSPLGHHEPVTSSLLGIQSIKTPRNANGQPTLNNYSILDYSRHPKSHLRTSSASGLLPTNRQADGAENSNVYSLQL